MIEWMRCYVREELEDDGPPGTLLGIYHYEAENSHTIFKLWQGPYFLVDDADGNANPWDKDWEIIDGPFDTLKEAKVRYLIRSNIEGWSP